MKFIILNNSNGKLFINPAYISLIARPEEVLGKDNVLPEHLNTIIRCDAEYYFVKELIVDVFKKMNVPYPA